MNDMNATSRHHLIKKWIAKQLDSDDFCFAVANNDASFRQYYRVTVNNKAYILMDAPPQFETCHSFVLVAKRLQNVGLHAPKIYAQDLTHGLLLLEDLGDKLYANVLNDTTVDQLYSSAINALVIMQSKITADELPLYNQQLLTQELSLFTDWFLDKLLNLNLTHAQQLIIQQTNTLLINNALNQPQTFVHRDYHSRNLLFCDNNNPGIIDFQDAVIGPITYDLVSLLKDCYIQWPKKTIEQFLAQYFQQATNANLIDTDLPTYQTWFDFMGVQRHLKAIGIFARLKLRDNKHNYIKDIPRTLSYVIDVCNNYKILHPFGQFIENQNIETLVKNL